MERRVPPKLLDALNKWSSHARVLRISHFVLVVMATVCTVLVAAKLPSNRIPVDWLAVLAALSVGLINALDLGSKSNRMRKAWRSLNAAVIWFEEDEQVPVKHLVDVYEKGEEVIGDVQEKP
jgi:hypothetical protein